MGLRRIVCSEEAVLMLAKWTGTPGAGVRVDPSSLTQEYLTAIGSKKTAADVNAAKISCEVRAGRIILRNLTASFFGRCELGEKENSFGEFATSLNNASTGFGGRRAPRCPSPQGLGV